MKDVGRAVAYPGLPVVFAEGFSDFKSRVSGHSHASFALTDANGMVRTETSAELIPAGIEIELSGVKDQSSRTQAIYEVIKDMVELATEKVGVRVKSRNYGVLTGSSDSGAAALVMAVDDMLELNLPLSRLESFARRVSETAYRSLYGGLCEYIIDDRGEVAIRQIKSERFFDDLVVFAIPFDTRRFSADDLHLRVTQHAKYDQRIVQAKLRIRELRKAVDDRHIIDVLRVMESEAKTVHRMFSEMGMNVIKKEMKAATDIVEEVRGHGVDAYWNVAGGSVVYVFTLKKYSKEVAKILKSNDFDYKNYRIAPGASAGM